MYQSYKMDLAGRPLVVDINRVGKQANGCAFMHYGDTTVLCTATASEKPRDGIDFFPLSVEYEEKMYAVGKIPGGFNKREGKASENAILTSRVIDRPMRPLFPKDYRNDVTLNNMVMSVDPECRPELVAMIGAAIATCISDIPFDGPCAMTQVGMIDGEFIINPSQEQWKKGDLNLTVASTREKVIMIEAGANEIPEATMIEAIYKAHEVNQTIIAFIDKIVAEVGKKKHEYTSCAVPAEMFEEMKKIVSPAEMEEAVFTDDKQTREENIRVITDKLTEAFAENEEWLAILGEAVYQYEKKTVRKMYDDVQVFPLLYLLDNRLPHQPYLLALHCHQLHWPRFHQHFRCHVKMLRRLHQQSEEFLFDWTQQKSCPHHYQKKMRYRHHCSHFDHQLRMLRSHLFAAKMFR